MDRKLSVAELPINTSPAAEHRRQMIWQVWVPMIASTVIVLAVAVLAIVGTVQGSSQINHWGNISAIYLIIPILITGLVILALNAGIIFGLGKLYKKMPLWMFILHMRAAQMSVLVRRGSDAVVQPIMSVNSSAARVRALWKKIFNKG
jgi:hypothetical protein